MFDVFTPRPWTRAWLLVLALSSAPAVADDWFVDRSETTGLVFKHFNGMSGELYFPEMMGAGVAVFDYDGDGDLDVYLVQGRMLGPGKTLSDATFPPAHPTPLTDRLYRNELRDGELRFTDVTLEAGLNATGYGMGVTTGDMDNDGDVDLYVTNLGHNQLLINNGNGTFRDNTAAAGVDDDRWSVSAAFLDFDRDGWLDLYVGNYVAFSFDNHTPCLSNASAPEYCGPKSLPPEGDRLFRNLGNGRFEDVTSSAGLDTAFGAALGVSTADFNGDGWTDIYVANDGVPNQLWINQQDGSFEDDAFLAGVAVNMYGASEASMGVDAADFDGDGDEDLFMTHLVRETNTLYLNDGRGWFEDRTVTRGLGGPSFAVTGFGTGWFDYDSDGWLDLLSVNGAVNLIVEQLRTGNPHPLHETNQLFRNLQGGAFEDVSEQAGAVFGLSEVSRGAAFGDLDNDGDADVVISNNAGPARLLINTTESGDEGKHNWLGLRLVDPRYRRDAYGASAAVTVGDNSVLWRRVRSAGSYASASDPRILAGLGDETGPVTVRVVWPDGLEESWKNLESRRYHTLERGQGQDVAVDPGTRR